MTEQTQGTLDRASKGPIAPPPILNGMTAAVADTVATWPNVVPTAHWDVYDSSRVDGIDFYVGEDELGHIHLDGSIHLATLKVTAKAKPMLRRRTGRPLSFDRDAALEKAMLTFWRHGYETSSIVDLTSAATAYDAARDMLTAADTAFTGKATPKGCLLASATASGSVDSANVQRAIADIRGDIGGRLRSRIERDISAGLLPTATDAVALAGLVLAVIQGMSVLARDGAPRARLIAIGNAALGAWPC